MEAEGFRLQEQPLTPEQPVETSSMLTSLRKLRTRIQSPLDAAAMCWPNNRRRRSSGFDGLDLVEMSTDSGVILEELDHSPPSRRRVSGSPPPAPMLAHPGRQFNLNFASGSESPTLKEPPFIRTSVSPLMMKQQRDQHLTVDQGPPSGEHGGVSGGESNESSPSWASSSASNTPNYASAGVSFEFSAKCTISVDNLLSPSAPLYRGPIANSHSSDRISTLESGPSSPDTRSAGLVPGGSVFGFHFLSDRIRQKRGSGDTSPATTKTTATTPPGRSSNNNNGHGGSTSGLNGKLFRLLRRTQSAGCSKDVPSHALFLKERQPISKSRSSEPVHELENNPEVEEKKKSRKSLAQDMKLRLGFLRRRHADAAIQSSVRPPPEEVQKWADSFHDLMASKYGQALFRAFLQREFSEENIEFWLACEDYKKVRPNKMATKARKIYNDFIAVQAPKEVNLDSTTRTVTVNNLANPNRHSFDQAQKRVQGLMERDAYLRFLQCELYTELLHPENSSTSSR